MSVRPRLRQFQCRVVPLNDGRYRDVRANAEQTCLVRQPVLAPAVRNMSSPHTGPSLPTEQGARSVGQQRCAEDRRSTSPRRTRPRPEPHRHRTASRGVHPSHQAETGRADAVAPAQPGGSAASRCPGVPASSGVTPSWSSRAVDGRRLPTMIHVGGLDCLSPSVWSPRDEDAEDNGCRSRDAVPVGSRSLSCSRAGRRGLHSPEQRLR